MNKKKDDLVSVIIPAKNSSKYIRECLHSIIHQTHQNLEILVCDDNSSDSTCTIVESFADERIRLIKNQGFGLVDALNLLIKSSRGTYICRMDADDIAVKNRIERQLAYIEANDFDCIGSYAYIMNDKGEIKHSLLKRPVENIDLSLFVLHGVPIIHPTAFGKSSFFKTFQYREFTSAEDYDLWLRATRNNMKLGNYPQPLLNYRVHNSQVSKLKRKQQARYSSLSRHQYLFQSQNNEWSFSVSLENMRCVFSILVASQSSFAQKIVVFAKLTIRELKCFI